MTNTTADSNTEQVTDKAQSSVTFTIDGALQVGIETNIQKDFAQALVTHGYLSQKQVTDGGAIELAYIVMCSEALNQIIEEFEDPSGVTDADDPTFVDDQ